MPRSASCSSARSPRSPPPRPRGPPRSDAQLSSIPGITPLPAALRTGSNYYKYLALLDPGIDRADLKRRLREDHGIGMSGEVYASPLHQQPIFEDIDPGPPPGAPRGSAP